MELKPAIQRYASLDKRYPSNLNLSDEEWEAMEVLAGYLKIFYRATLKLSGTKYPTLNLFFPEFCEVFLSIKSMANSSYPFVILMGKEMLAKWEKYWTSGNLLLAIACVLDPRCKLGAIEYYLGELYPTDCDRLVTNLKNCLGSLYKEYLEEHSKSNQTQGSSNVRYKLLFIISFHLIISTDT